MSSRAEQRREKQQTPSKAAKNWRAVDISEWILCCLVLLLIIALPWYYGTVEWRSQYVLAWAGVVFCAIVFLHCVVSIASKSRNLSIPWLTWLFFLVGFVAFIQSKPLFSWQGNGNALPSVQIQRWALGLAEAPKSLEGSLLVTSIPTPSDGSSSPANVPCDLKNVPDTERNLAWSIEPLHTRGAAVSLLLCGLFVWIGHAVFSNPRKQLWLFIAMTAIGVLIACVGIQGAISYQSKNFLGLISGGSFATFVSKNSAGGFYNICIAGCLGLLGWTLLNTQRSSKDNRYRFADKSILSKIRGFAEDSLADLNTAQITSVLCLVGIVAALMISLCRGAAVSALGAIILASLIANAKNRSRGSWAVAVIVITAVVACMVGFQVDDQAYSRLESLSEIDIESELREGRAYIWQVAWKAMKFYGWLGSGLGTFHFAYLPFQEPSSQGWFYHAESLYAQCGVELGYLGVTVIVLAIIKILSELQRPAAKDNWGLTFPSKLAGTYLVISQALHSFVDFAIILPALFIPTCVMVGSVQGTLRNAEITPIRKRSRGDSTQTDQTKKTISIPWLRNGLLGLAVAAGCGLAIFYLTDSIRSLSTAESMVAWTKAEEKKPLEEQIQDRVRAMAVIWASDDAVLRENSVAMRSFADSLLFEYRMNQFIASPPTGAWNEVWRNTSPLFLQLALQREQDPMKKDQFIESIGGKDTIDILERSANWYALGQTKSPLDWRLLWGRCLSNTVCDRNEIAKLLPASMAIAKHNAQQLQATTIVFRNQLDQSQFVKILAQAMKANSGVALNSAELIKLELFEKNLAQAMKTNPEAAFNSEERTKMERLARELTDKAISTDKTISIDIFPQRYDILQSIAKDIFTKADFPETNRQLWERARKLIEQAPMTASRRELWLADSSKILEDIKGEIDHLGKAVKNSNDIILRCRLANLLIENDRFTEAKEVLKKLQGIDPLNSEVKKLAARINEI